MSKVRSVIYGRDLFSETVSCISAIPLPSGTEGTEVISSWVEGTELVAMAGNNQRRARVLNVLREMVNEDASPAMEE